MKKVLQYFIDFIKQRLYSHISGENKKLKTGMQQVLLLLKSKRQLPKKLIALEMFGMHGLWHTMDYIDLVDSLDIFELDKTYSKMSMINLPLNKTTFYNEDSIHYIKNTKKKYNFLIADIPFNGPFYNESGIPLFLDNMISALTPQGILIFNCHTAVIADENFNRIIKRPNKTGRMVRDFYVVPKNNSVTYAIIVFE